MGWQHCSPCLLAEIRSRGSLTTQAQYHGRCSYFHLTSPGHFSCCHLAKECHGPKTPWFFPGDASSNSWSRCRLLSDRAVISKHFLNCSDDFVPWSLSCLARSLLSAAISEVLSGANGALLVLELVPLGAVGRLLGALRPQHAALLYLT